MSSTNKVLSEKNLHQYQRCRLCHRHLKTRYARLIGFGTDCAEKMKQKIEMEKAEREGQMNLFASPSQGYYPENTPVKCAPPAPPVVKKKKQKYRSTEKKMARRGPYEKEMFLEEAKAQTERMFPSNPPKDDIPAESYSFLEKSNPPLWDIISFRLPRPASLELKQKHDYTIWIQHLVLANLGQCPTCKNHLGAGHFGDGAALSVLRAQPHRQEIWQRR